MSETQRTPSYFDLSTGAEVAEDQCAEEASFLIDRLVLTAGIHPQWRSDGGAAARLDVLERGTGASRIAIAAGDWRGMLSLSVGDGGWVRAEIAAGDAVVLSAVLHRPYEEIELLPDPVGADDPTEPPGRMGKRLTWISLSISAWPVLAGIAQGEWFNAEAVEEGAG